ncbi:MAG: hypothetical protein ACTMIR_09345 [Cellulomonadaceae bacterium]
MDDGVKRIDPGVPQLLVVANLSGEPVTADLDTSGHELVLSNLTDRKPRLGAATDLAPWEALVLRRV